MNGTNHLNLENGTMNEEYTEKLTLAANEAAWEMEKALGTDWRITDDDKRGDLVAALYEVLAKHNRRPRPRRVYARG